MLTYLKGDVTEPQTHGEVAIIAHVVNDVGVAKTGVAAGLLKKFPQCIRQYEEWHECGAYSYCDAKGRWGNNVSFKLGQILPVIVSPINFMNPPENEIWVIHLLAQRDIYQYKDFPLLNYQALTECLDRMDDWLDTFNRPFSVHLPKLGAGRGKADFINRILPLVQSILATKYPVFIYEYEEK